MKKHLKRWLITAMVVKKLVMLVIVVAANMCSSSSAQTFTLRATKYHPGRGGAGWRTASGDRIDNNKLRNYEFRWVALSPDLFKKGMRMGDTIIVECERVPKLNGEWIVKDKMGPRMHMRADFLLPAGDNYGFLSPTTVTVTKKNGKSTTAPPDTTAVTPN